MIKKLLLQPDKSSVARILFVTLVTFGIILLIGGLFLIALAMNLPTELSDTDSITQSVASIINQIPGVPVNVNDLTNLTMIGIVSWIIGLNILLIGLGLWVKSKLAKWTALGIFALATLTDFIQFLLSGILGSPGAIPGVLINGTFLYFISKLDL